MAISEFRENKGCIQLKDPVKNGDESKIIGG